MKRFFKVFAGEFRKVGMAFGRFNNGLLMAVSFYLILFPTGLIRRVVKGKKEQPGWIKREPLSPKHFEKQG